MRILLDHLYQNLVAELVQDLCFRLLLITCISLFKISCGPLVSSLRCTCARSEFQDPFDHFYEDPVRPLVQDLCIRVLYDHLCKISVSGSCWTTVSGSGWTTCARSVLGSLCEDPLDHLYLSVQDFLWTTCIILEEHLRKISISGSFRPLLRGSCKTTCARSLYEDPVRPLVQDLCFRILILLDHLSESCSSTSARSLSQDLCMYEDHFGPLVSGSCRTTCTRSLYQDPLDRLCWDPVGPPSVCSTSARSRSGSLYEDPFGPLVSGSCRTTCTRSLYQGPLDRLCQDPVRPLVQDLCIGILLDHCIRIRLDNLCKICLRISVWGSFVSGSCRSTCTRSLLWGHLCKISVSGSCTLAQDLCVRIHFWATCIKIL